MDKEGPKQSIEKGHESTSSLNAIFLGLIRGSAFAASPALP